MASTAAILSILVKANTAGATAALRKTQGELKKTSKDTDSWKGKMAGAAKVAGVGMAAGVGLGIVALKGFANAAMESEKSNARMRAQLKASGISWKDHGAIVKGVIEKQSAAYAMDDEDLQDSFTNIVRVTGDVNKALQLNALAADFARAKNIDVAKAGELVGKVAGGNTGILSRYGITLKEGATSTEALAMMQKKFSGQAEAYGKTAAAGNDRFKIAVENLQEALGAKLLPVISKVMNFVASFVNSMTAGSGAAGGFGEIVGTVWTKVSSVVSTVVGFLVGQFQKHRDDYAKVAEAAGNVGRAIAFVWQEVVWPVIRRVLPAIMQIIKGAFDVIGGAVKVLSNLLTGNFRGAWEGVKQIFSGALQIILGLVRGITAPFREAISRIGDAAINILDNAWDRVKQNVRDLFSFFRDAGGTFIDRFVAGFKAAPGALVDAAKWLKDKIVGAVKKFLGIDSPSKVFQEIGGHMISGLIKGMDTGDVLKFIKSSFGGVTSLASKLFGGIVGGGAGIGGKTSGTWQMANMIARKFGLSVGSNYRSPEHNAAVGGVPNSLHTHGSPSNPGAFDLNGPVSNMNAALAWVKSNMNLPEAMVHDVGSGLHLHLGFFKKGGFARGMAVVGEGGPEIVDFGSRGAQVYSNPQSQAMMAGGPFVNIEHMSVHSGFEARAFAADLAWRVQTA